MTEWYQRLPYTHGEYGFRRTWQNWLQEFGPTWMPVPPAMPRITVRAWQRRDLAAAHEICDVLFVRLTPAGVALRDRWAMRMARDLDRITRG